MFFLVIFLFFCFCFPGWIHGCETSLFGVSRQLVVAGGFRFPLFPIPRIALLLGLTKLMVLWLLVATFKKCLLCLLLSAS